MEILLAVTIDFEIAAFVGTLMGALIVTYIANKVVNWILLVIFKRIRPAARAFSSAVVVAFLCISTTFVGKAEISPGEHSRLFWGYLISVSIWLAKDLKRPDLMKW